MQSSCKPCGLKEIVRIERRGHGTISKAWVRISEKDPWCSGPLIIDFPFREIARQCSKAGKEVGAKKRRTPSNDRAVAKQMFHAMRN